MIPSSSHRPSPISKATLCRLLIGLLPWLAAALQAMAGPRPNVILIMADDLGYETIGANGGTSYRTPVLDRLAASGMRFDRCFAQPLCTPTRIQLMTGAYNVRNYLTFGTIDPNLTTFGHLFRDAGYATAVVGKWQLGHDRDLPTRLGFSESCLWQHTRRPPRYANPGLEYNGEERDFSHGEYGPDLLNAYALDFIARHRNQRFFLYYPMVLTHAPYQPTPRSPAWDPSAKGEQVNRRPEHFGHLVEYLDELIGRVVTRLSELGLREQTLLVFLGDNGTGAGTRSSMGDRVVVGGKGRTTAAGMHVPLIAHWPGTIAPGTVCPDLIDTTDFLPTLCEAAEIPIPRELTLDGRSFLPQLQGRPSHPRPWLYSWYSPRGEPVQEFAFDRQFKLYRSGEFFDLEHDPEERQALNPTRLDPKAVAARTALEAALARFKSARPSHLPARPPASQAQPMSRPSQN